MMTCRVGAHALWHRITDLVSDLKSIHYDSSKVSHGTVDNNRHVMYHNPETVLQGNGGGPDDGIPYEFFVYKFGGFVVAAARSRSYHAARAESKTSEKRCEAEPNYWAVAIATYIPIVGYASAKGIFELCVNGLWTIVATSDCSSSERPGGGSTSDDCSVCLYVCFS